jgi:hypothetical protein
MHRGESGVKFYLKTCAGWRAAIGLAAVAITLIVGGVARSQDDWEAAGSSVSDSAAETRNQPESARSGDSTQQADGHHRAPAAPDQSSDQSSDQSGDGKKAVTVCGEQAVPASTQVKAMVDRINGLWGTDFRVYQTISLEQPHASPGGCIFYNPVATAAILAFRLDVKNEEIVDPLVWAIFAHEIGHQYHHDTEPMRKSVASETMELEADRFSGYTLEKLGIRATDLTPYWNLTGDEFGGGSASPDRHGVSAQRVAAFKEGWHLAEWNRPESSGSVTEAEAESVAPDSPDAAPK